MESLDALLEELRKHWTVLSTKLANVEDIAVLGMDLTKRARASGTGDATPQQ